MAVGSLKASPGATTAMLALAAVWPSGRSLVLVEADPDGGVLAARFGLSTDPGLATVAPSLRREARPDQLLRHAQILPGGTPVIVGPSSPDHARLSIAGCASRLGGALAATGADAILDCGRLTTGSAAAPLLATTDLLLVVVRPRLEELQYLLHRLPALQEAARDVVVLLIGDTPYRCADVEDALGADRPWVGELAHDPRAAGALNGAGRVRHLARSPLIRSAREVLATLERSPAPAYAREAAS